MNGIGTSIKLNADFSKAAHARKKQDVLSSLRSDAERMASEITSKPDCQNVESDSLLIKAWMDVRATAREQGRKPNRAEVLATLHTYKDHGLNGAHI